MKINICGDFTTEGKGLQSVMNGTALSPGVLSVLKDGDINVVNLEAPVRGNDSVRIKKNGPHLGTNSDTIKYLNKSGFHLLTLANNHFYDCGDNGVKATLQAIGDNGLSSIGGGETAEKAREPIVIKKEGIAVGFLNYCENEFSTISKCGSNPLDLINVYHDIKSFREKCDYLIVIVHGGHEGYNLPSPRMKKTYRFFIEAGANLVVNHHQHCHTGWEDYQNGRIYYGLGNFFFDRRSGKEYPLGIWNKGFMLQVEISKSGRVIFTELPYHQCYIKKETCLLEGDEKKSFFSEVAIMNDIIRSDGSLQAFFDEFCSKEARNIKATMSPYSNRILKALCRRYLLPSFFNEKRKLDFLNKIRCEAHLDVLVNCLKNNIYGYN